MNIDLVQRSDADDSNGGGRREAEARRSMLVAVEAKPMRRRRYRMGARAKAAAETGERILDAAEAVFDEHPMDEFTLNEVAEQGITVQTILRRFGSRQGLIAATLIHVGVKMGRNRGAPKEARAPPSTTSSSTTTVSAIASCAC